MKPFLSEDFLLETETARKFYFEHASDVPIIDYHCHLPPQEISEDKKFKNLTRIWLEGDHYKWRAMRTNGVDEKYITGKASDYQKFEKWAETVPFTMRNPLYHWTHMELKKPFGVNQLLHPGTASEIFERCSDQLQSKEFSTKNILRYFKVEVLCTTDDPADNLKYHQHLREDGFEIGVLPTFRPDKAISIDSPEIYNTYLDKLGASANVEIRNFSNLLTALDKRHNYFHEMGCRLSDHGLEHIFADDFTESDIENIFDRVRNGKEVSLEDQFKFKSSMLLKLAELDHSKEWTQQFHLGALRNNNTRMMKSLGPDTGFDSIGDFEMGRPLSKFLDTLDENNQLAKTILYNVNPRDNYLIATMTGNFNDGSFPGKVQFGSGWWFLDQKEAMEWQLNALSNLGLLSRFVGMITDSRSFLSYPRHDYFRRILCNLIGNDVEKGLLPGELEWLGKMIENISYYNARHFFNLK